MATAWTELSNSMADAVEQAAPSVVQVRGRRRPGSGIVYQPEIVVTNARALGSEDGLHVQTHGGARFEATLAGWDPATGLAVLRVPGLDAGPIAVSSVPPRPGHLAVGVARSWSGAVTASTGTVAVIGGPLPTGRRQHIAEVIRTTAPMHDGFAGGAFLNTDGALIGVPTAASIRGLRVVIPTSIVWETAAHVLRDGRPRRGYLGIAGQQAPLSAAQQAIEPREHALLVVAVTPESPAAEGGVLVGDLLLDIDGTAMHSADALLDLLAGGRIGTTLKLRALRGTAIVTLDVTVGARPAH
jgi:S1-C subfamily serine protease